MRLNYLSDYRVFDQASEKLQKQAEFLGYAAILLSASPSHKDRTVFSIRQFLEPALSQKRVKFYFNEDGNVVGYVIWAWLAQDVEYRVAKTGWQDMHESEWNEGGSLWIVDLLAPSGHFPYVLRDLKETLLVSCRELRYGRIKRKKWRVKQIRIKSSKRVSV